MSKADTPVSEFARGSLSLTPTVVPGNDIPTMITANERECLSLFAQNFDKFAADGAAIVDAGTFLGSSTTALAYGLRHSSIPAPQRVGRIWSYDLFRASPGMIKADAYLRGKKLGSDGSFRSLFNEATESYSTLLNVFEGDIVRAPAPPGRVGILFLDVLWSYDVSLSVTKRFYPKLDPGRSVLIHQDFIYPYYPWIIIHMGLMRDFFRPAYNVPLSSMVFDVTKPISESDVPDPRAVDYATGKQQFERFIDLVNGWGKGALMLGLTLYAASKSEVDEANKTFAAVKEQYENEPLVSQYFPDVVAFIAAAAKGEIKDPKGGG